MEELVKEVVFPSHGPFVASSVHTHSIELRNGGFLVFIIVFMSESA